MSNDTAERCGARTRSRAGTCKRPAGWGTGHPGVGRCRLHGGTSPNHELSGALALARRELRGFARPIPIDPQEALLELIAIAYGEVMYATEQIADLDPDKLVGPVTSFIDRPLKLEKGEESSRRRALEEHRGPPAVHVWVRIRWEAVTQLHSLTRTALAARIAERRVEIAQQQGVRLFEATRDALVELGVDVNDPKVIAVVRKHLLRAAGSRGGQPALPVAA